MIELRVLVTAAVAREHEAAVLLRVRAQCAHRLGAEGQLLTHTHRHRHAVRLLDLTEARRDEQTAIGEEIAESRAATGQPWVEGLEDPGRMRRHPFEH